MYQKEELCSQKNLNGSSRKNNAFLIFKLIVDKKKSIISGSGKVKKILN
jgi:hypothetical protein